MTKLRFGDRPGRFALSMEVLNGANDDELALLFSRVRVWRAEPDIMRGVVVYHGTSAMFRQVSDGSMTPWYRFTFTRPKGGKLTLEAAEADRPVLEVVLPDGYGWGVVQVPAGMRLVDVETGEDVCPPGPDHGPGAWWRRDKEVGHG